MDAGVFAFSKLRGAYMRLKRNTAVITAFVLSIFVLTGCENKEEKYISSQNMFFDTVVSIKLFGTEDESIIEGCDDMMESYEEMFSRTIETSDVSRINSSKGKPVEVSDETIYLIETAVKFSEMSEGVFDITTAPLSDLWNIKENPGVIPDEEEIKEALSHVGYENIVVEEGNIVYLTDPEASIDLGALAKGYAGDKLKEYIKSKGVESGIIDLGGNIVTIGSKLDGSKFNVGIQKPFDKRNEVISTVSINDKSVVSSGNYERYFEKDGKIYHHIFNPFTGYPVENDLTEVTIVSDSSLLGDCYSTTCFALGKDKGMKLIKDSSVNIEAYFISDSMEITEVK